MDVKLESAGYDVIYLAGCAVNNITPNSERIEGMDMESVCRMSRFCGISALVWQEAKPFVTPGSDLANSWEQDDAKALERNIRFDRERDKVTSFFNESGIWYLPFKGTLIRDLYPEPYLREMSDNDFLIDTGYFEDVRQWFLEQGYEEDRRTNQYVHTAFNKKPVYRFEIHRCLFGLNNDKRLRDYYSDVEERLLSDEGNTLARHFSDDDFCVYLTAHGYKHRTSYGIGIRALLDCYVYLKEKRQLLDQGYIRDELTKLGLAKYAEQSWDLAWKMFADPDRFSPEELNEEERELLEEFLLSGTYGTVESRVAINLGDLESETQGNTGAVKMRYLWRRVFPDAEYMARYRPIFGQYKWLIPAGYVYRLIYECRKGNGEIRSEIKILRKM